MARSAYISNPFTLNPLPPIGSLKNQPQRESDLQTLQTAAAWGACVPCVGVHSPISLTYPLADVHTAQQRNAFFQKPYYVSNAEYPKITPAALPLFCAGTRQPRSKEVDTHSFMHTCARTHTHTHTTLVKQSRPLTCTMSLTCSAFSGSFTVYLLTCTHCKTLLSNQLLLEHPRESVWVHNWYVQLFFSPSFFLSHP